MSLIIPLQPIPNQSLSVVLDGSSYDIRLNALTDTMAVTIARDNVTLLSGLRVVSQVPLIPYLYLEQGNFIFTVDDSDIPFYTDFGVTQTLLYFSSEELRVIRGGS